LHCISKLIYLCITNNKNWRQQYKRGIRIMFIDGILKKWNDETYDIQDFELFNLISKVISGSIATELSAVYSKESVVTFESEAAAEAYYNTFHNVEDAYKTDKSFGDISFEYGMILKRMGEPMMGISFKQWLVANCSDVCEMLTMEDSIEVCTELVDLYYDEPARAKQESELIAKFRELQAELRVKIQKRLFLSDLESAVPAPRELTDIEFEYGQLLCDEYAFNGYITEEDEVRKTELEIEILKAQIEPGDTFQRVLYTGDISDMFVIAMFDEEQMFVDFHEAYNPNEKTELECWRELVSLNGKKPKV